MTALQPPEKRDRLIALRLTTMEYFYLNKLAEAQESTASDVIRSAIFNDCMFTLGQGAIRNDLIRREVDS